MLLPNSNNKQPHVLGGLKNSSRYTHPVLSPVAPSLLQDDFDTILGV